MSPGGVSPRATGVSTPVCLLCMFPIKTPSTAQNFCCSLFQLNHLLLGGAAPLRISSTGRPGLRCFVTVQSDTWNIIRPLKQSSSSSTHTQMIEDMNKTWVRRCVLLGLRTNGGHRELQCDNNKHVHVHTAAWTCVSVVAWTHLSSIPSPWGRVCHIQRAFGELRPGLGFTYESGLDLDVCLCAAPWGWLPWGQW